MSGNRVFRDPIYGYISVPAELIALVDHQLFQRLRRISQTSLTQYVYPTATGSRFEHALGSMHLAGRAWKAIWNREVATERVGELFIEEARDSISDLPPEPTMFGEVMGLSFQAAALLHDVGHTPFSHALEGVYRDHVWNPDEATEDSLQKREVLEGQISFHEYTSRLIAKLICDEAFSDPDAEVVKKGVPAAIQHILESGPGNWAATLHGVIAGQIDVDRIDYLIRDSDKAAGSEFGSIDYIRLLDALELSLDEEQPSLFRIRPRLRARSAVETLLIQRLQAYEYIHFHSRVVGYNLALERATELFLRASQPEGADDASMRKLFRGLRPNLVYWDSALCDVAGALGLWEPPGQGTVFDPALDSDHLVQAVRSTPALLRLAMAGVDDDTILETLKRAHLLLEAAPPVSYQEDRLLGEQMRTLKIFSRAALFRRKNFVSAWKSVDEYMEAASEMKETLLDQAPARLRARADQLDGGAAKMCRGFAEFLEKTSASAQDERVAAAIALNSLVDLLLSRRELLVEVRDGLNRTPTLGRQAGAWGVAYTGTGPIRRVEVDLQGPKGPVSIVERSPLAEAVWFSEQRRMKLAVYFFFENRDFSDPDERPAGSLRGGIRKEVVERFPGIALDAIDSYV
jgi:HD superfamily phosphohydrolase